MTSSTKIQTITNSNSIEKAISYFNRMKEICENLEDSELCYLFSTYHR